MDLIPGLKNGQPVCRSFRQIKFTKFIFLPVNRHRFLLLFFRKAFKVMINKWRFCLRAYHLYGFFHFFPVNRTAECSVALHRKLPGFFKSIPIECAPKLTSHLNNTLVFRFREAMKKQCPLQVRQRYNTLNFWVLH